MRRTAELEVAKLISLIDSLPLNYCRLAAGYLSHADLNNSYMLTTIHLDNEDLSD